MVANNNNNNINNSDRKKKKIIIEGINIYMELEWVHCRLSYCQKREKNIRDRKKYNKQKHKTNKNGNYNNFSIYFESTFVFLLFLVNQTLYSFYTFSFIDNP